MSNISTNKKYKRPKQKTTNAESSGQTNRIIQKTKPPQPQCPLAAKDSEWVDILQTPATESAATTSVSDEEEVLQLVECEDGPQMRPLAIMFPDLLEKDPNTLEGVLNKVMSTTEVTKHLVDLGQKANFTFMKKAERLIPRNKQWLERLTESSNSFTSVASILINVSFSSEADEGTSTADALHSKHDVTENTDEEDKAKINCSTESENSSPDSMANNMEQKNDDDNQ